jgi:hypothetical protein
MRSRTPPAGMLAAELRETLELRFRRDHGIAAVLVERVVKPLQRKFAT